MKFKPELVFLLLLFSCIYDPPQKGKEILIHNQTGKQIIILDSLTENYLTPYDTATVNGRRYKSRRPNYIPEYGIFQKFYSDVEINRLKKKKNKFTLYIIGNYYPQNTSSQISINHSFRSFEISIDTLKKYELNHLFISNDTVSFEHEYSYNSFRKG